MTSSAAPRYIGYVGGVAVAAGIGAAVAVAASGAAHADEKDSGTKHGAVDAGPKTPKVAKPLSEVAGHVEQAASRAAKDTATTVTKALQQAKSDVVKTAKTAKTPTKPSAKEFEADQVAKLTAAFTPKAAAATTTTTPKPTVESVAAPSVAKTTAATGTTDAALPGLPNPFRADDPDPDDMPASILALRNSFVGAVDPALQPYAREGFEAAYRFSQTVPYLNVAVPATKILPAVVAALAGDDDAKAASQVVINQLLLTTQPVSLLYYGYDELADLANLESEGTALKQQFYVTAWNTLDPLGLLHVAGESGLTEG